MNDGGSAASKGPDAVVHEPPSDPNTVGKPPDVEELLSLDGLVPADTRALHHAPEDRPLESLADAERFRVRAGPELAALIAARGAPKPVVRRVPKVSGGCGT